MSLVGASFCRASAVSRTCVGKPYSRSSKQVWQTFLILAQVWHMTVVLNRMPVPGFHRKTVKGRAQVPHERPNSCLDCSLSQHKAFLNGSFGVPFEWKDYLLDLRSPVRWISSRASTTYSHVSQRMGNSLCSHPALFISALGGILIHRWSWWKEVNV